MPEQNINVKIDDAALKGVYSNMMMVSHTREEFILDFLNIYPAQKQGVVVSRVITSPEHLKRLVAALTENMQKYENQFGKIEETSPVDSKEIGFRTQ
ncbi:MAG: DUF3467 domain-containing protein [Candidatus Saccharibacteria bacterium]